ncbi:MAG: hypothetical protein LBH55_00750 [Mycoplasmataceae bacterium]|jgi:hypothetical protein|nr:hypothetical protein [Mycoplasmataceae bacterium]
MESLSMMEQIYIATPGQDGTIEMRIRSEAGSLPALLGNTCATATNDNQGRSDEYYRRLQPNEGVHNDGSSDAFDNNIQQAHAISKKKTGKNLAAEQQRRLYSDAISEEEANTIEAANRVRQANAQSAPNQQNQPQSNIVDIQMQQPS